MDSGFRVTKGGSSLPDVSCTLTKADATRNFQVQVPHKHQALASVQLSTARTSFPSSSPAAPAGTVWSRLCPAPTAFSHCPVAQLIHMQQGQSNSQQPEETLKMYLSRTSMESSSSNSSSGSSSTPSALSAMSAPFVSLAARSVLAADLPVRAAIKPRAAVPSRYPTRNSDPDVRTELGNTTRPVVVHARTVPQKHGGVSSSSVQNYGSTLWTDRAALPPIQQAAAVGNQTAANTGTGRPWAPHATPVWGRSTTDDRIVFNWKPSPASERRMSRARNESLGADDGSVFYLPGDLDLD